MLGVLNRLQSVLVNAMVKYRRGTRTILSLPAQRGEGRGEGPEFINWQRVVLLLVMASALTLLFPISSMAQDKPEEKSKSEESKPEEKKS